MISLPTSQTVLYPPPPSGNRRRPFLTPIPDLPGEFLLVLDNTSLEKIKRCHMAARNYLVLGREGHDKTAALTFGGAIHEALAIFHKEEWQKQQGHTVISSVQYQEQAIHKYYLENPLPASIGQDYRTPACALEVMSHYRRRANTLLHPDYEWEILEDEHGPIIERAFEIPLQVFDFPNPLEGYLIDGVEQRIDKIHLAWSGRIDILARCNRMNRVVDHKTSSIEAEAFTQSFQLASQTLGYTHVARRLWPQFDVSGFCANVIYLKKPSKTDGPGRGLCDVGPRGGAPRLTFDRHYYEYPEDKLIRWERDTILLIEDFLHSLARGVFPLNDRACFDKYGRCPYWDCCTLGEEIGDRLLASDQYKTVTWNPVT